MSSTLAAVIALAATSGAEPAKAAPTVIAAAESAKAEQAPEKRPAKDPEAIAALEKMGAFLREQKSFTVHVTIDTDHTLDNGLSVRTSGTGELRVRRPDHLRADISTDRKDRQFFYDGKKFTMNAQKLGYFASIDAPATIKDLADELEDRYNIELPMVDLFRWGTDEADTDEIKLAMHVGTSKIAGVETDQYAFRQPGLDWQIWIERGDHPLPRKILLTTTDDAARPTREVTIAWNLDVKHEDSTFTFVPGKDSHAIAILENP
jgi:hypothetical protein